ncbi:hypothetical protein AMTR_s00019p00060350 [Amborella trichopoda]|uniref:Major facilitator superfamily (MFS) profile domain-containing protein n=2 Tax=Amborella trichopoda TaxID=13333 RepID=W1PIX8_AMBTC|nr:hypothetical protein AMTR_s00019p00060350 [Amborella trichopoda]
MSFIGGPVLWLKMLSDELHWTFVTGVVIVYGISQGLGGALSRVASDYYWKDVQLVQPSASQFYQGITYIPWVVKPLWGLFTDVCPVAGYKRRPYFILAGLLGVFSMLVLSLHHNLHVVFALICLTAGSAGVAIADVTIDACVAQNSIRHPPLAPDMQSLCGFSSSIGALLGFSISGFLVYFIGSQGALGLMSIPAALVLLVGVVLNEPHQPNNTYKQVYEKLLEATKTMWTTLKCPNVWRPCVYMLVSLAITLNIHEGLFYWITDPKAGPAFSQEIIGFVMSVGSVGALIGVLLYQNFFKDYSFRGLLFWTQLLFGFSGMLDLVMVFRLNLKYGVPDFAFVVIDEIGHNIVGRLRWMPLLVLSSKLCPSGIEGTFFALLMSIDNVGLLLASWGGGLLLHLLKVTRTEFGNLWAAILIRNLMRFLPLALLFLIPNADQNSTLLPMDLLQEEEGENAEEQNIELVALVERNEE